jgi:hypothetical protein
VSPLTIALIIALVGESFVVLMFSLMILVSYDLSHSQEVFLSGEVKLLP